MVSALIRMKISTTTGRLGDGNVLLEIKIRGRLHKNKGEVVKRKLLSRAFGRDSANTSSEQVDWATRRSNATTGRLGDGNVLLEIKIRGRLHYKKGEVAKIKLLSRAFGRDSANTSSEQVDWATRRSNPTTGRLGNEAEACFTSDGNGLSAPLTATALKQCFSVIQFVEGVALWK